MESAFTRVAVVQLEYRPAQVASFRSPLEDPGGATPLLPASADIPQEMRGRFEKLRGRVRQAYCEWLLARLDRILASCRSWEVKIVVLPEYSVPWDILDPLARAAGPMVVVAGTHYVERDALRCGLYEHLGCAQENLPKAGQAVAPILHAGRILALVPKLHADEAAGEEIAPAEVWRPVPLPEGFAGPMGVLVGTDFLHREAPHYRKLVGEQLSECRFLAVPSRTSSAALPELQAKAWEEARRYGRPVLYADHAGGGGTAFFVDEDKHSSLLPYPEKPGCLRPLEEGLLVADIDMGYQRPGGSARFAAISPVRPQAAASLVHAARPLEREYAEWLNAMYGILSSKSEEGIDEALAHVERCRPLLRRVRDAAPPTRRERLDRLLDGTRFIAGTEKLELLLCEMPFHPSILPMDALRAAQIEGAKEAAVRWLANSPALGSAVTTLLDEASRAVMPALDGEALQRVELEKRATRGRVLGDVSPSEYFSKNMAVESGVSLSFRRSAQDLEMRLSPRKAASLFGSLVDPDLPRSEHTPPDDEMDHVQAQLALPYSQSAIVFSDLLTAERAEPAAAVVVSRIYMMYSNGMVRREWPGITFDKGKIFLLLRHGAGWRLATYDPIFRCVNPVTGAIVEREEPLYPQLDEASRQPILDAFEEWGIDVEGIDVVTEEEMTRRFDAVVRRFDRAQDVIRKLRQRRLAEVGGNFVEPSLEHERISDDGFSRRVDRVVAPALSALAEWLGTRRSVTDQELRAAIVLGEYGSGKSTLLTEWALRLWEAPEGPRPLLVDLAGSSAAAPAALLLATASLEDTPENRAALRLVIRSGKLFPVFDGFDEMATRVTVSELPQRLADLFDTAQFVGRVVLSSRDHYFPTEGAMNTALSRALTASLGGPSRARRFDMRFFSDEQVRALLLAVTGDAEAVEALWVRIRETYDLEELCRRPILLAMIIAARRELLGGGKVKRGDLYETCLHRWLCQVGVAEREIFTHEQKRLLAETIAVETWRSGEPGISLETLRRLLPEVFSSAHFDDVPRTAEVLETTGGMFLVRQPSNSGDHYRFAHKSFQEYFLATALVRATEPGARALPEVLSIKPLTREVIDFVAELIEPGDETSVFVGAVQRWLATRCTARGQEPLATAGAAANAVRLLCQLSRLRGDEASWLPPKADLRCASLAGEDLQGIRLTGARLERADLSGARLCRVDMKGANLKGALLRGAKLDGADLSNVLAEGADFTMSEASGAVLRGASLKGAALRQSMWVGCLWEGASYEGADVEAWMAPDAQGLGPPEPTPVPWTRLELAAEAPERRAWREEGYAGDWRPDGLRITAVTSEGSLLAWDAQTRRCLARISAGVWGSFDRATARWASAADVFVSLSQEGELHAFHERDLRKIRSIHGPFQRVAVSADGTLAALADERGQIHIVRLSSGEEVARRPSPEAPVLDFTFSADGGALAVAYGSGIGMIWWFASAESWTFHMNPGAVPIRSLAWDPSRDLLAYSTDDFLIRFVRSSARSLAFSILTTEQGIRGLRFSADGAQLAGLSTGGALRIWNVESRQNIDDRAMIIRSMGSRPTIAWSPDGTKIATFGGAIEVWDLERGARDLLLEQPLRNVVDHVRWSETTNCLVCRGPRREWMLVVDCSSGEISWIPDRTKTLGSVVLPCIDQEQLEPPALSEHDALRVGEELFYGRIVRRHLGGECAAVAYEDGRLSLLDAQTNEVKSSFHEHKCRICLLEWNHDGSRLASVDESGVLCLWDMSWPRLLLTITTAGEAALGRTPGGYYQLLGGATIDYRFAYASEPGSCASLHVPIGGLRDASHNPEKVAAALRGDLSGDDASAARSKR